MSGVTFAALGPLTVTAVASELLAEEADQVAGSLSFWAAVCMADIAACICP